MKNRTKLIALLGLSFGLLLNSGCKKEKPPVQETVDPTLVKDADGNVYHTVTIGKQVWMVENLKVTKYRNGESIPNEKGTAAWIALTAGAYCSYDNDDANAGIYGRMYNWHAVNDIRGLAPKGWHIPSDAEYTTLVTSQGTMDNAASKLKEAGVAHWINGTPSSNSSGFTALPGGARSLDGLFYHLNDVGYLWSSTEAYGGNVVIRMMIDLSPAVTTITFGKGHGFYVRCIKD